MKKLKLSDNKTTLAETIVSHGAFKNLTDKEKSTLNETVQDLINFIIRFPILCKVRNKNKLYLVGACKKYRKYYCGRNFTIMNTYENNDSKILHYKNLTKNIVQTLLNELFSLDQNINKNILKEYIKENNTKFD